MSDDMAPRPVGKTDVAPEHWDSVFAPSSCLTLITTVDGDGRVNAASFGTCTRVCHAPVYIAFTCGTRKDTYRNVLATGEFTVNVVPFEQDMLNRVMICGLPFRYGINELEKAGLTAMPAQKLRPPRIAECRTHFECKVAWTQQWENRLMVCGKVAAVSIDEDCVTPQGAIVWDKVKPAHFCGMPYRDHFVPAYDKPTRGIWQYEGPDEEFREGENWRREFNSTE
jgi:flavin reductase (DIM6/NTAB) family NADH-FMN oxidoreductase RutF